MSDVTLQNFETEVIDASRQMPVLVDFWAPWCGPCRTLGPMLERLEAEADGQWKLAKVNVDENQELAAHFGVRSIPHVVAIADGQAVDQFTGVLPESGLREFLARLAPGQGRSPLDDAMELAAAGNRDGAETLFADAIAADPESDAPRLAYIGFLLDGNAIDRARAEFAALSPRAEQEDGYGALRTRIEAMENAAGLPDAATLAGRIDADPRDLAARMDLARLMIAQQQYEPALEQLLAIVRTDRGFEEDIGRRTMLSVFEMLADRPDVVSRWRRQLSTSLN
ncbi:thioredoxin [Cupriavidus taiwanensis]|uniref:Thioredoxin n=1 Tax=Cupriavidus taiwanensis TaxID=164546 RepID=A0A7Z7JBS8_9BURK|nr:thioredoxin [Cupriavidus taiwanensis]SOY88652.1 putative THIOREDOXIN PROTEIN [Cupriavidus taiwanensis]SOZ06141.1 putative THIOREDOXIN PROTEIN [Cupriavidus taiwanensis]SOZ08123.1 putative THIOREDOXIN PROTEIN [Cupriavidus taiwanensis]SPC18670.1 putative THIOREDOXIN PROTEIN [Cupriavidus taiwanensis]SPD40942.1 putative THIOREDOXIN PROTEIN [Cupriavidus taiwanensis]